MKRFVIGIIAFVVLAALASAGLCPKGIFPSRANAQPKAREKCEWSGEVRYERSANYASKDETLKLDESFVAIVEVTTCSTTHRCGFLLPLSFLSVKIVSK